MSSANIGWLFYKDYYKGLTYTEDQEQADGDCRREKLTKDECLIDKKVKNIIASKPVLLKEDTLGNTKFQATTTYPGLLLGSGNAHEIPSVKHQVILGFHFDYTSGLPEIQGSSIKGVLRSSFQHPEYIQALLGKFSSNEIKTLETQIFDNADIFFDAIIIKAGGSDNILGDDYITPHSDPLKDPKPLRFIKVLPDVTFLFQFELSDSVINDDVLTKEEKESLFRKILGDLGLGAKTNLGYGKFSDFKAIAKTKEEIEKEEALKVEKEEARLSELSPLDRVFDEYNNCIPNIVNAMKANKIEEVLFVELAEKIKSELIQKPKEWEKAKQKSLKRKEYIQSILGK